MIHEFIADKKSVEHGDAASLAQMLLTTAYPGQQFPLTNPFFFSPIKRRLKMLTNVKNPSFSYARRIVVLPLLSIVVLLFSFRTREEKMIAPVSMMDTTKKVMIVQGYKISPEDTLIASKGNNKSSVVIKMDAAGGTGNAQKPLFILDGEVISESVMSVIDPNKIESINILKDASAVAVFGEKGKGGVVQITTKKGKTNDAPAAGRIVLRGVPTDNSKVLEERVLIVSDTVQLNGKTVFVKSNNLKDGEFMATNFDGAGNVIEKVKVEIQPKGSSKNSPSLIFIDGEKKTKKELDALSPDQIKSVEILKGESAIKAYGTEADSGGGVKWRQAVVNITPGVQTYSIREAVSASLAAESGSLSNTSSIEIRRVLHNPPPAITRYFDPFVGTGLGSQQLLDSFNFGGFSPSISFMMMPIHADLLRLQAIEFNDQIRKSHYTFEIHGDDIKFWPIPTFGTGSSASSIFYNKVWIEYLFEEEKSKDAILFGNTALINGVVSDASNIPYTYQNYSSINDMGRAWIFKYGLAVVKEMLGYVRNKYS
jgi:TonB-dependent SusC/RagA subfamily outer membrane receptor